MSRASRCFMLSFMRDSVLNDPRRSGNPVASDIASRA
jgi:hypothetical protein